MPTYKKRKLQDVIPTSPPLGPLTGGKLAKRDQVATMFAEQDRILGHGRRILAAGGLNLCDEFRIPSTDSASAMQTYPSPSAVAVVARQRVNVTPGHILAISVLCVPSGPQQTVSGIGWEESGKGGQVRYSVTYDNGVDTEIVSDDLNTPVSANVYAAETDEAGASFAELTQLYAEVTIPGIDNSPAVQAAWSENVTAEIVISYLESVRVADFCVFEIPHVYAREFSDAAPWTSSLFTNGQGAPLASYPVKYPVSHTALGGDPSNGYTFALATAARQTSALGPMLICQSSWNEGTQTITATEPAPKTTTSTTFVDLWQPANTSWSPDIAGWSLASGGNAPAWNTSGPHLELRDKARVVPVRVSVYAKATGGATGRVQLVASDYSVAEIVVDSSSYQWFETDAHLLCGFGAEDESIVILLGRVTSAGTTLSVQHFQVQYIDA